MCGIAGFYGFRNDRLIHKFSKELSHRGPDGEGFYFSEKVSLLNRRLAIIDRVGGDQPIYNENNNIVIVYNGEIYNYQELRQELLKSGHKFTTVSDTEVIIHAYEEWGEDCFDKLNGMFAIALYDIKKDKLYLARDHFGIKPLYYSLIKNNLIFSSEISPIFYSGLIPQEPNNKTIYRYLKYRVQDEGEETFFSGISQILPGEMLILEKNKSQKKLYTTLIEELSNVKEVSYDKRSDEQFKEKLISAVKQRLISEVPVGTCLSGGLDSSCVVSIINKLLQEKSKETKALGGKQKTFSAVFPGEINNEEKYIDEVIRNSTNIESYKIYPQDKDFFQEIIEFIKIQEEPTISTGPYAQYKVMEKAKQEVTVLLDGQGADEILAGYLPYYLVYLRQLLSKRQLFLFFKESFFASDILIKLLTNIIKEKLGLEKKLKIEKVLKSDYQNKYQQEKFIINNNNLKKRLLEDIFENSLPSLLRYEDRNSMAFSLEGRVPFLDIHLLKYVFSLSDSAIIENGWNKNILRSSMKELLPDLILQRRNKIGFTTPENAWFKKNIPRIYEIFLSESFNHRIYWQQKEVLRYFWDFIDGKNHDTMFFWRIINLEIWLRIFFPLKDKIKEKEIISKPPETVFIKEKSYQRIFMKTDLIKKGDKIEEQISQNLVKQKLSNLNSKWFLVISEKIVAISQGRSFFIWDIHPSFLAKFLSDHVTKTKAGIGLGSPFTMQLAINEVGIYRILLGALLALVTKPLGLKGVFYHVAGKVINQIDGPTEYSLYPSNVSAKLGPKNPERVVYVIDNYLKETFTSDQMHNYLGSVIIDANDLGQNILGNSTGIGNQIIKEIFKDNPMGQGKEQTPVTLITEIK